MRPQTFIVNQTLIIVHEHYAPKVNHRQSTQKERARYCEMGRGGERKGGGKGYGVGSFRRQLFLVLTIVLNQQEIF